MPDDNDNTRARTRRPPRSPFDSYASYALAVTVAVAVLVVAAVYVSVSRSASVLSGPMATLPAASAAAVSYTTRPGLGQATALAKAVTSASVPDEQAATALASWLPSGAAGMGVWPGSGQPWAGPRYAWSWQQWGARAVQVAAVEVSDEAAARAWASAELPAETTTWNLADVDGAHVLRIAATGDATLLEAPQLRDSPPSALERVDAGSPAVVWADLERLSDPVLYGRLPQLARLADRGVLGPGTVGQVALGVTVDGDMVAADGAAEGVMIGGAPLAVKGQDVAAAVDQLPATTSWAVAVADPNRLADNWAVAEMWGPYGLFSAPAEPAPVTVTPFDPVTATPGQTLPPPPLPTEVPTLTPAPTPTGDPAAGTQLVVASSDTRQLGAVFTGADPARLESLFAPFTRYTDAQRLWAAPVRVGDRAASAESQGWAEQLAIPSGSASFGDEVPTAKLLPGGERASAVGVFRVSPNASGVWEHVSTVGVVVGGGGDGTADVKVRAALRDAG